MRGGWLKVERMTNSQQIVTRRHSRRSPVVTSDWWKGRCGEVDVTLLAFDN